MKIPQLCCREGKVKHFLAASIDLRQFHSIAYCVLSGRQYHVSELLAAGLSNGWVSCPGLVTKELSSRTPHYIRRRLTPRPARP